jgi:hypothetical protein
MNYNDRWNKAEEELASLFHLAIIRPLPTVVTLGEVIEVTYLLDTPHGFTWKGVFIDAELRTIEAVNRTLDPDNRTRLFTQLSSLQGSILENRIFEDDIQVQSMSTAKLMTVANGSQVPIITIDATNVDSVLPTLPFDQNIKDDITDAVNQKFTIRIPQSEITYQDWTGIGYIKENPATGESGWMLSGMIAGGMTAWDIDKWNAIVAGTLSNPYSEPANYDPAAAHYIEKIISTDMQDGTVGTRLDTPLQVRVLDSKKKPVMNVQVTFTIKAGGGTFGNDFTNITTTTTAITNAQGIASASPILGRYTNNNPTFVWDTGNTYSQQAGENIIDAALPTGTNLTTPFTALGMPGAPDHLNPLHGNNTWGVPLSFAGFVSAAVEDVLNNPISNITVTFSVADPVQDPYHRCEWTTIDITHKTYLTETGLACINNSPTWGACGDTNKQKMTAITSHTGAAAEVILGGMDNALYTVTAIASSLSATFALHTYELYSSVADPCGGANDPYRSLMTSYAYSSDVYGNNIDAGKTGTTVPVTASMHYFLEKWTMKDVACGSGTCAKVVGTRHYETTTDLTDPSMTFGGMPGIAQGGGVYAANYQLQAGKNVITVKGTATITVKNTHMSCPNGCNTVDEPLTQSDTTTMTVFGVTVQTQPIPMLLVNDSGYLSKEQTITYTIEPLSSDYQALSAYTFIYKDGSIVAQIPTETEGTGTATISRGFQFDPNSVYEVEVILNYGTGVEIRGNRATIPVAQVRVLTDESFPKEADEIKFSDGSNNSNGTKKYHIAIKSQSWLSSCETLTGRIVTLSTVTATMGQPVSTPQNTGSDYASQYPLNFKIIDSYCVPRITDTVDGNSYKDKFIISNRPRTDLDVGFPSNVNKTAVLYAGIGNQFMIEVGGVRKLLPIEPVGVVILGIDGLRQDVLYSHDEQKVDTTNPTSPYYVSLSEVKGFCAVMGGKYDDGVLGVGSSCDPIGAENKHIKLKDVTAIFPSITFASWASIFTGKMPKDTGILGNEFFARDLVYTDPTTGQNFWQQTIWGLSIGGETNFPAGMVTLDADGGAFSPGGAKFALRDVIPAEFSIFGYGGEATTLSRKMLVSAPNDALSADPLWSSINAMVGTKYAVSPKNASGITTDRCDRSEYECATVSIFNQYARGSDWWGTPSNAVSNAFYAALSQLSLHSEAALLDESSAGEAKTFITGYFSKKRQDGKQKSFPALFSVYLPGLDHEAHLKGMGEYVNFFKNKTDANVKVIVDALKDKDEFDNKIFIIVADHGHTAMPTNLTYPITLEWIDESGNIQTQDDYREAEMSCSLKLKGFNKEEIQLPELANNNLHIWELGEVLRAMPTGELTPEGKKIYYKVLSPPEIVDANRGETTTTDLKQANVIVALNGPMAHIYVKGANDWNSDPQPDLLIKVVRLLNAAFAIGDGPITRLASSVAAILIRRTKNTEYVVYTGATFDETGQLTLNTPIPIATYFSDNTKYVDALTRIKGMNHPNRSGDIILIMKDATTGDSLDRYTTGVACKSWHGSLNPSDSYVPLVVAYPGGNNCELDPLIQKVCASNLCEGNWKAKDLISEIIKTQYAGQ